MDYPEAPKYNQPDILMNDQIYNNVTNKVDAKSLDAHFTSGPVECISLPGNWERRESDHLARGSLVEFAPKDGSSLLVTVLQTGRPLSDTSLATLRQVFDHQSRSNVPKALTTQEITSLTEVLGRTTLGDNQFSNNHRHPDPQAPAFNLISAMTSTINGKPVLEIKGAFLDDHGNPQNYYRGILVLGKENVMEQLYMQNPTQEALNQNNSRFREIINSIRWRNQ